MCATGSFRPPTRVLSLAIGRVGSPKSQHSSSPHNEGSVPMARFLRGVLAALVSTSALAAIGGGWYWHTIHSPVYAVQQIASGLATHDAARVHQYLDTR